MLFYPNSWNFERHKKLVIFMFPSWMVKVVLSAIAAFDTTQNAVIFVSYP
jgi:hypothetical protein